MRKKHLVLALGAAAYCVSANCAERDKKPNVIIVYSDGRSLMPVIKSASAPDPHKILHFDFLDQWAVREGDWKLIHKAVEILPGNYRKEIEDEYFLSNLKTDPSEKSNLASKYPGIVEKLKAQRETFVAKCAGND